MQLSQTAYELVTVILPGWNAKQPTSMEDHYTIVLLD